MSLEPADKATDARRERILDLHSICTGGRKSGFPVMSCVFDAQGNHAFTCVLGALTGAARFTGTPENKASLVMTVPMGRLGLSEELANAIVFIVSDDASFITGHILNVDGGKTSN